MEKTSVAVPEQNNGEVVDYYRNRVIAIFKVTIRVYFLNSN